MEAFGSHVEGIEKSLVALELSCCKDRDCFTRLEANHEEFTNKLDLLINLLSSQPKKSDCLLGNGGKRVRGGYQRALEYRVRPHISHFNHEDLDAHLQRA